MHPNTDGTAHKINALFETRDEARGRLLEVLHKVRKLEKEKAHQMETDPADQRSDSYRLKAALREEQTTILVSRQSSGRRKCPNPSKTKNKHTLTDRLVYLEQKMTETVTKAKPKKFLCGEDSCSSTNKSGGFQHPAQPPALIVPPSTPHPTPITCYYPSQH